MHYRTPSTELEGHYFFFYTGTRTRWMQFIPSPCWRTTGGGWGSINLAQWARELNGKAWGVHMEQITLKQQHPNKSPRHMGVWETRTRHLKGGIKKHDNSLFDSLPLIKHDYLPSTGCTPCQGFFLFPFRGCLTWQRPDRKLLKSPFVWTNTFLVTAFRSCHSHLFFSWHISATLKLK